MSSPDHETKASGKTTRRAGAAKAAAPEAAKPAASEVPISAAPPNDFSADAMRLVAALDAGIVNGTLDVVSSEALQDLLAAACRAYGARSEAGERFAPVRKNTVSATDVMVTASGLLRAADLAVFELGMWQNWTGR
jgi:hypothetical protein